MSCELQIRTVDELPTTFEDVTKFAILSAEKLKSVRAEISAVKRLGLAREVLEQKVAEAQKIAELKTYAEMRIGELTAAMPTAHGNRFTDKSRNTAQAVTLQTIVEATESEYETESRNSAQTETLQKATKAKQDEEIKVQPTLNFENTPTTKAEALDKAGIRQQVASEFERMNQHKDVVERVLAEKREAGDIASRADILKAISEKQKEERKAERAERKQYEQPKGIPDTCKLYVDDIRSGLTQIPDNSVDFIITDPPYMREYLDLYKALSAVGGRVLKEGGSMLVMCGQSYLPDVMKNLSICMDYHWTLSYLTPGGQSPSLWQKRTNTFWKPILWFTNGEYKGDYIGDVIKTDANDNDKRFHEWGQNIGGFKQIIEKFTYPKQVILDPFLGGGTTGVAACMMDRQFIGVDIDDESVRTSRERIMEILK